MNISKVEYFALEILRSREVSVDKAWALAAELAEKSKVDSDSKLTLIDIETNVGVEGENANAEEDDHMKIIEEFEPIHLKDVDALFQKDRRIKTGQVWYNWANGSRVDTDEVVMNSTQTPLTKTELEGLSESEFYKMGESSFLPIAASYDGHESKAFIKNGWQWILMTEGESIGACLDRNLNERKTMARCEEIMENIYDAGYTSVRTNNALQGERIQTFADLLVKTEDDLIKIKNFGVRCMGEVKALLKNKGWYLGMLKVN